MALQTYFERIRHIDNLIRRKATGNLNTLSGKLNLSRSQTVEFLNQMKYLGFPIKYSRKLNCYYYTEDGSLVKNLFQRETINFGSELTKNELKKISGGKTISNIFFHADYTRMSDGSFA